MPRTCEDPSHIPHARDLLRCYPGVFLIAAILTIIIYWPGLSGEFLFDDYSTILYNEQIKISALTFEELKGTSLSFDGSHLKRPVSMLSFALTHYLFGPDPFYFKLTNTGIHILTGIGIYLLCSLLFFSTPVRRKHTFPKWLPALVASAWLLAPVNLTTVLYVTQRMTGLASLFMLLGLLSYTVGRVRQLDGRGGYLLIACAFLVFLPLAVFSKENGILLIPYLLITEAIFFRFKKPDGTVQRSITAVFLICAALPAILGLAYLAYNPDFVLAVYAYRDFTLMERLLTESRILWMYIKFTFIPTLQSLGIYHDDITLSTGLLDPPTTLISLLALAGLFIAAFPLARRAPVASFGILIFFISHSIESTILPLELAHEHRNYLASVGIIIGLVSLPYQLQLTERSYRLITLGLLSFLLFTGSTTFLRSLSWGNRLQFAVDEARHHPDSPRANGYAGQVLLDAVGAGQTSLLPDAVHFLEKARDTDRRSIVPEISMIIAGQRLGLAIDQSWHDSAQQKLKAGNITHSSIFGLYGLYGCFKEAQYCTLIDDNIVALFRNAADLDHHKTILIYGMFLENVLGKEEEAESQYRRAIAAFPDQPLPYLALARTLIHKREWEEALIAIEDARKRDRYGIRRKEIEKALQIVNKRLTSP